MSVGCVTNDFSFFAASGEDLIVKCFYQVLKQNNKPPPPPDPPPKKRPYKRKKPPPEKRPKPPPNPESKPKKPRKKHVVPPIDPDFKEIVENLYEPYRFDWPSNKDFSNVLKHLRDTYIDNVVTNLKTHAAEHLTEWLKLLVFEFNQHPETVHKFLPSDIYAVVDLIIKEKEIKPCDADPFKLNRCENLYDEVLQMNKFPHIDLHELLTNKEHWFKAMPMHLAMQREIEAYNLARGMEDEPRGPRMKKKGNKKARKRRKPYVPKQKQALADPPPMPNLPEENQPSQQPKKKKRRKKPKKQKSFEPPRKQMLDDPNYPPSFRNLVVVPKCTFRRTHIQISLSSMYQVLASQKFLERVKTETGSKNIPEKDFNADKYQNWNRYFYMRKIRRFVRNKKTFDYSFLTDGVSVSLLYSTPKKKTQKEDNEERLMKILEMLIAGIIVLIIGIDPGMKSYNTTVTHNIAESKEVCIA